MGVQPGYLISFRINTYKYVSFRVKGRNMDNYVIVNNGYVIAGPWPWARVRFETVILEDLEVTVELPSTMTPGTPYVVDDNTSIYSVAHGEDIPNDPRTEFSHGPLWDFSTGVAVYHYEPMAMELDSSKTILYQEVADIRWLKEVNGCKVTLGGVEYSFGTDRDTRNVLSSALSSSQETLNWKINSETWITLTKSDLQTVVDAIALYVQSCFDWEKNLVDQINACETAQDIKDVVIENPFAPNFTLPSGE
jgi:hypothetical protein